MTRKLKVLVSAYACEPGKGSEPGVGWNWVGSIAQDAETWVLTRANNRSAIEGSIAASPRENIHWVYYDLPRWMRWWKRKGLLLRTYYCAWQLGVFFQARGLHRQVGFDCVHHLTFGTYWLPTFLCRLPVPFIWGPLGGGTRTPRSFMKTYPPAGRFYESVRDMARALARFNPVVRYCARHADLVLANNDDTRSCLQKLGARNVRVFCHTAVEVSEEQEDERRRDGPCRFISAGRLIHWKGYHLALAAFSKALSEIPDAEYWIFGDGPEWGRLKTYVADADLDGHVHLPGAVKRHEVEDALENSDVFVHPALHDSAPFATLEAMAHAKPIVCLALGGPGHQVTPETGFAIRAGTPGQAIEDMKRAMITLAVDPELRRRLGHHGQQRARDHYSRDRTLRFIREVHASVVSSNACGQAHEDPASP